MGVDPRIGLGSASYKGAALTNVLIDHTLIKQ